MSVGKERLARIWIAVLVAAAVAVPLFAWQAQARTAVIHAALPENGGWIPRDLKAEVGKPVTLRLTSDDVLHGFGLGQSNLSPVDIYPGEVTEVTLTFDKPGRYTFYCTRWCSVNHWRMRGVIEVTGPEPAAEETVIPPLYVTLGLDIDAEHHTEIVPEWFPSARRGEALKVPIPAEAASREVYRSHSPVELWQTLRNEPRLARLSDRDLWDLVALTWSRQTGPEALRVGKALYEANCAACHGSSGGGDGVFAEQPAALPGSHGGADPNSEPDDRSPPSQSEMTGEMIQAPTDFTDPNHSLAASPAHWQGKILRGGMGTGMPAWGAIFTEDQTWALVAYLWTFQFDLER